MSSDVKELMSSSVYTQIFFATIRKSSYVLFFFTEIGIDDPRKLHPEARMHFASHPNTTLRGQSKLLDIVYPMTF